MKFEVRNSKSEANPNKNDSGLTLVELMVVIIILSMAALIILPGLTNQTDRTSPSRINCVNNLKQIGVAFQTWASDHGGNFPMQVSVTNGGIMEVAAKAFLCFQGLSNELSTPKILVCPAEEGSRFATNFQGDLSNSKISYFVGIDATKDSPQMFLAGDRNITNVSGVKEGVLSLTTNEPAGWTHGLHERQGNVGLADGSVQQFSSSKLREALRYSGDSQNRLAMPQP